MRVFCTYSSVSPVPRGSRTDACHDFGIFPVHFIFHAAFDRGKKHEHAHRRSRIKPEVATVWESNGLPCFNVFSGSPATERFRFL